MFLCGANDLITIFVAPECFSLCSYLLSGYTKRDIRSNEATMKYLLMGGSSTSILVRGLSWIYGLSREEIELQEIVNGGPGSIVGGFLSGVACKEVVEVSDGHHLCGSGDRGHYLGGVYGGTTGAFCAVVRKGRIGG
ncbi:hypothetical protein KSP40_PGU001286 [Platanthera guangdongensis]|uniref:NADH:quinone oxidoreductase/Mrp antiporter transmembrane domain-containing protein n=1 Tax=Platanthera guangdongensis TaxID=2320717 RepID=A0ABR2MCT7_9ASPA